MIVVILLILILLNGCSTGPDMTPIGGGLAVIGLAIVIGSIVIRLPKSNGKEEAGEREQRPLEND